MFGNEDCKMVITNPVLPRTRTSNRLLSALKLVISIPDHSLSAKYREWSGIINLEGVTGVVKGIDTEMVKDRKIWNLFGNIRNAFIVIRNRDDQI